MSIALAYWERHRSGNFIADMFRHRFEGAIVARVFGSSGYWTYAFFDINDNTMTRLAPNQFSTMEKAMVACDKELEEHGYEPFSKERTEKIEVMI